jgi:hypothetical protein
MYRQHRAERESTPLPDHCAAPTRAPVGPFEADGAEPPIEIDDSVDVPVKDDLSEGNEVLQSEVQLISYLGDLPSPTDPAFDVFGTIMLPVDLAATDTDDDADQSADAPR